jgi:hypothetical protein
MITYPFPRVFDRSRYSEMYLMGSVTEAQVQENIVGLLSMFKVDVVAIDAGGRRQRGRMMGAAAKAGVDLSKVPSGKSWYSIPPGFPDLEATLAPRGVALYIEVKAPAWTNADKKIVRAAGSPSRDQLDFLMSKHQRGAEVIIAWSADDVLSIRALLEANLRALSKVR